MISAEELRSTLTSIQTSITEVQNTAVKSADLTSVVNAAVQSATAPLVSRLERCEGATKELHDKLSALTARFDAIVESTSKSDGSERKRVCVGNASVRSASAPASAQRSDGKAVVVLKGFPHGSRKQEIEGYMKEALQARDDWRELHAFAPNVRSSIALIKMESEHEVKQFIRAWKNLPGSKFKGNAIRATADKPPEQRKANAKVYSMSVYLRSKIANKDVDADFKRASVWVGDAEVVKWDIESDIFRWMDDAVENLGGHIDKKEAEAYIAED